MNLQVLKVSFILCHTVSKVFQLRAESITKKESKAASVVEQGFSDKNPFKMFMDVEFSKQCNENSQLLLSEGGW